MCPYRSLSRANKSEVLRCASFPFSPGLSLEGTLLEHFPQLSIQKCARVSELFFTYATSTHAATCLSPPTVVFEILPTAVCSAGPFELPCRVLPRKRTVLCHAARRR